MLLLASQSPRRRELLQLLNIPFSIVEIKNVKESYDPTMNPEEVPEYLSRLKASAYKDFLNDNDVLITADTIVLLEGKILGKPKDEEDAKKMLSNLSGKTHKVITGVTITTQKTSVTFSSVTEVKFSDLSTAEIDYYVSEFKPLDKAGAYGIQEWIGAVGVESIDGSFYNVMGLPVHRLYKELRPFIQDVESSLHTCT